MNFQQSSLLIQALNNPALFDHPVTQWQVLETHISWVLLTGSFAYKIKKPVDLGFVDFSTLEKRHASCLEEVRLNKRLAPELYLRVVPISGSSERPILGSESRPIEYAVQMKQFPVEATLDHVVSRGELEPRHMDQLAIDIARFHGTIAVAEEGSQFGTPEMIAKVLQEVSEQCSFPQTVSVPAVSLTDTLGWMKREQDRRMSNFSERKTAGYIRECHGDLHLANLVLLRDRVVPFDGIEFSERLRWIDVMNDLAFLIMDFAARGRSDFAFRFLNAYLEQTGDYAGVALLRYYQVYRALVRVKVAGISLSQSENDPKKISRLEEQFQRYVSVVRQIIEPSVRGIVLMHGVSGSGKTTLSQDILESLGAIRVRSDVERKRLFGIERSTRSKGEEQQKLYGQQATDKTYGRLFEVTKELTKAEYPVIVDATFLQERYRAMFRTLAEECRLRFVIVDVQASRSSIAERVTSRLQEGHDVSDADVRVVADQEKTQDPFSRAESPYVLQVNSEAAFNPKLVREALSDR